jgi:hypothetical protein
MEKPFHVTQPEQLAVALFLVARKNTQADLRRNERAFVALGLTELVDTLIDAAERPGGETPGSVRPSDWASRDPIPVTLDDDTTDHLIKVLDTEHQGPAGVILHRLYERLRLLSGGLYRRPTELDSPLPPPEEAAADNPPSPPPKKKPPSRRESANEAHDTNRP